jgi:hypothetical protein
VRSGRWPCSEPSSWPLTDGSEADYPTNETETAVDASLASLRRAVEEESPATAIAGAVTAVLAGWRRLERDSPYRTVVTGLFLLIVTVPPCRGVRGNRGHRL